MYIRILVYSEEIGFPTWKVGKGQNSTNQYNTHTHKVYRGIHINIALKEVIMACLHNTYDYAYYSLYHHFNLIICIVLSEWNDKISMDIVRGWGILNFSIVNKILQMFG